MEESEGVNCCSESRSSSESRPPNPNPNPSIASAYRQCQRSDPAVLPCRKSLVRHASLVSFSPLNVFQRNGVFFVYILTSSMFIVLIVLLEIE